MKAASFKNNVKTEVETIKGDDDRVKTATHWLKRSGEAIRPSGFEYAGSAVVHYYKGLFNRNSFTTVCQASVEGVEEGLADFGWKNLRKELMRRFGRTEKQRT